MKKIVLALALAAGLTSFTGNAKATIINFDSLPSNLEDPISSGYAGFNWNNFYALNPGSNDLANTGYGHGVVSSGNVVFDGFALPASLSRTDGSLFSLVSAYFTSAWQENNHISVQGYVGSNLVADFGFTVNTTAPLLADLSALSNVDTVIFTPSDQQFAMDNLTTTGVDTAAVPEPSQVAASLLLVAGIAGFLIVRRKNALALVA